MKLPQHKAEQRQETVSTQDRFLEHACFLINCPLTGADYIVVNKDILKEGL